ncbi:MAG: hypothetical protein P1V20_22860 [Verrucomicrobiales bacterium]|nr:hypothetical protein [Verrucomicrobiales bacterium]
MKSKILFSACASLLALGMMFAAIIPVTRGAMVNHLSVFQAWLLVGLIDFGLLAVVVTVVRANGRIGQGTKVTAFALLFLHGLLMFSGIPTDAPLAVALFVPFTVSGTIGSLLYAVTDILKVRKP